ncbi:MAG: acetylxylan esterase [Longimicrobiales bacterium]|nr:acetylxylan esterase [Longimicrobiales bacterium]
MPIRRLRDLSLPIAAALGLFGGLIDAGPLGAQDTLMTPAEAAAADPWLEDPVDDATFRTFLDFYSYDDSVPLELRTDGREERDGVIVRRITYQSTPGERVPALLYTSAAGLEGRPTLIELHGATATGKDEPSYRVRAERLVRAGFNVLVFDMPLFGERSTDRLRTYTNLEKHQKLYNRPALYRDWVIQVAIDARRAVDLVIDLGADPDRIGLAGYSRGGILAPIVGAVEPRFAAVAAILGGHMDALEQRHLAPACPANFIGRISPRPLLMIGGSYDSDHIRETSLEPLSELAREPVRVVWSEAGHMLLPEHEELMTRWFRTQLR